jgi:hypothetical protein
MALAFVVNPNRVALAAALSSAACFILACSPNVKAPSTVSTSSQATSETTASPQSEPSQSMTAPSVSTPGSVPPPPSKHGAAGAMCGGIAGFGCAPQLYCDFALGAQCGAADQSGVCKPIPEMCTEQYQPVCGCDDKTYPNVCFAAREGIAVAALGECAPPARAALAAGALCGTRGVEGACGDGLYCKYNSACGATDTGGSCVPRPQACTKIYRPVCGCDGQTYASDCVAASEGVDVASVGACASRP